MLTANVVKSKLTQSESHQGYAPYNVMMPIYDYKTTNTSFLEVHKQLKMLGINNNAFHLILLNPMLQGVNPHSPDLTPTQVMMIIQECKLNMFYYLREVVLIEENGGGLVRFKMDRGTLAACYHFVNNINFYLMKPRQTGKTVGICAMLSWAFKFQGPNGSFLFSCYEEPLSVKNLRGMRNIISHLPRYMANMGTTMIDKTGKVVRKTDNVKTYAEPTQNNKAMIAKCAHSEESADRIGRGYSHIYQYFDEAEFIDHIDTIVKVSGMSFNTASRSARKNHTGYCRIFSTTPGNLSSKACQSALKIVNDCLIWSEKNYDTDVIQYKRLIKHKSVFRIVYIEYDYKQLGLGEDWFIEAVSNVGADPDKVRREILLQRFAGNSNSPFTVDEIEDLNTNEKKPIAIKKLNRIYEILFYEKPRKDRIYFMGIDPSDGTGSDNYAITVVDPYTLAVVAEFRSSYMTIDGCVDLVTWLVDNYFSNPVIVIERNRNGGAVAERFKSSKLRNRLYSSPEATDDKARVSDKLDENGFIKEEFIRNKYFGTTTTPTTRKLMMNILLDMVHFSRHLVTSKYVIDDINHLVVKNEKIQAAPGEHDDSVMSWLIAMYVIYYGQKLERWGFRKGEMPNDIQETDEFKMISKLYKNPEIRRQFPTMYVYYQFEVDRRKRLKEYEDAKAMESGQDVDNTYKIGGVNTAIVNYDPAIDDAPPGEDPFVTISTQETVSKRKNLVNAFLSLNK